MGLEFYFDVQVAGGAAARGARTLTRKADLLTRQNALGYLNVQSAFLRHQPALVIDFRHPQCKCARSAIKRCFQVEQHLGVVILAATGVKLTAAAAARSRLSAE